MRRNETKKGGLTRRQIRAIEALLAEPTIESAAKAAGVSKSTLFRWLNDPVFDGAYREARGRLLEDATATLQKASADAAQYLHDLVNDQKASVYARLTAAKTILELAFRSRELEIDERLQAIEQALEWRKAWR